MQDDSIIDRILRTKQSIIHNHVAYSPSPTRIYLGQREIQQLRALAVEIMLPYSGLAISVPTELYGLTVFEVIADSHFFIA
jgi:hypothetical protein